MSADKTSVDIIVTKSEVKCFIERCMVSVGVNKEHSTALADVLTAADYRGHYSHGLNMLKAYINGEELHNTSANSKPCIIKETVATAYVNGNNSLGPVVGNFCMELAIKKAKAAGVGWVVAKGSNHYGIASWYSMQASHQGLLGMSFTNSNKYVIPTRGKKTFLGTNPITLAAPGIDGDSFVLDMATSTVALGKLKVHSLKKSPIPAGWAVDKNGKETHDPKDVLERGGGLLPLGGSEETGGYKGYGLALLVEIFCSILGGAAWGPHVKFDQGAADLGQCFIAVDPECFSPDFGDRIQEMMNECRDQEAAVEHTSVLIPGDPERINMTKCDKQGGILYNRNLISSMDDLAKRLNVQPLKHVI